ncbi:hypothetical protein cce_4585 [Crocosphaera subtropica ATCC 51142]|uniref:MscS mechanosensitive ion channel n=2 Tax=Crocosphaera TaxID=263510 RepID=B1WVE3_CROS5|nr:hypothetical protein cce_4585 [Crocosphaera subtropica ATCC 51142]
MGSTLPDNKSCCYGWRIIFSYDNKNVKVIMKNLKLVKLDAQRIKKLMLSISRLIIIFIVSLTLTLTWTTQSFGQISLFSQPSNETNSQTGPWDLNQAYTCGKFWCSDVYIHDDIRDSKNILLTPELTLATLKKLNQSSTEATQLLEKRAKVIEQTFNRIVNNIIITKISSKPPIIKPLKFWKPAALPKFLHPNPIKPLHPCTPKIKIGIKNNQTVIFIDEQLDVDIASQSIITVTEIDATANGKTIEDLAKTWQNTIELSFSNAFWGYEFDRQYPQARLVMSSIAMGIALLLIMFIELLRTWLRRWDNGLRQKLKNLTESITVKPEASTPTNLKAENNNDCLTEQNSRPDKSHKKRSKLSFWLTRILNFIKKVIKKNKWLYGRLSRSQQKIILQKQSLIKQERNFAQLLLRISFILQILSLMSGFVVITLIFRDIRFLSVFLLRETLNIIFLWIGLTLLDKIGDFMIDYYLNRWANQAQIFDPTSNRYTLRINTYSVVLKQATTFITIILGIYGTLWLIGLKPSVLAGAGILTVALAFLSRNLLEDMLNGVLILSTDRYAIGDVIDVGEGMGGLVENINLFVTSLRNLDGQVIAIPNSKISTVINNTKEWSRVNFTIKIAWNEDIKRAIDVMNQVANQMQNEPEWGSKILEPMEVLGIDEVSHEGILIHVLIKTQPSEHWGIGREFRLRVKQAFDEMDISLGIPHRKIV